MEWGFILSKHEQQEEFEQYEQGVPADKIAIGACMNYLWFSVALVITNRRK